MLAKLSGLASVLLCTAAVAASAPQPQPVATGDAMAAAKARGKALATVAGSPVVMETRAVVMPDGSIRYVCEQKRNPHPVSIPVARPAPEPQR